MIEGHRGPCDEGMIRAGAEPAPCREQDKPWVLTATILGSSLAFITGSVVNVALPAIQQGLGASAAQMQWARPRNVDLRQGFLTVRSAPGPKPSLVTNGAFHCGAMR